MIELKSTDAKEAKAKWEALQSAQEDWKKFQKHIEDDYTTVPQGDKDAGGLILGVGTNCLASGSDGRYTITGCSFDDSHKMEPQKALAFRRGWEYGFEFDRDFRFIVPVAPKPVQGQPCNFNNGCYQFTPSFSTPGIAPVPSITSPTIILDNSTAVPCCLTDSKLPVAGRFQDRSGH